MAPTPRRGSISSHALTGKILLINGLCFLVAAALLGVYTHFA